MTITILSITALALIILLAFALKKNAVYQTRVNTLQEQLSTVSGQVSALNEQLSRQQARLEEAQRQVSATKENEARLSERLQFLSAEKERIMQESETKLQFITEEKERIARESEERFKNLASEILKDNSRQFKEANETRLAEILNPLRENIEAFKKSVADAYNTEARERFSLQKSLRELVELNQTIGREAQDLTAALKGNSKVQGDWGEMILENILEKSGLRRGHEYDIQVTSDESGRTLRDEQGRGLRPDVVIYYPDKRCIVVDSKVSLTAYTNYVNAETEEQRAIYGKNHLQSIRSHIAELAHKKYQEYIGDGKTDFVMMFIPNEGAYIAALQLDPTLWQEAYDARVLLVSPTHLFSALRLVAQLWNHDRQSKNAIEIAKSAGAMVDKFVGFTNDMLEIEKFIAKSHEAYDNAMRKLSTGTGNLVARAQKLQKLGAKAEKQLPKDIADRALME